MFTRSEIAQQINLYTRQWTSGTLVIPLFSLERTCFSKIHNVIIFLALVALKLLVSLISRLVACSARIVVDTHTQTDRHIDQVL